MENGTLGAPGLLRVGFHSCITGIAYAKVNGCMGGWLQHNVDAEFEANNGINDRCESLDTSMMTLRSESVFEHRPICHHWSRCWVVC